MKTKEEVLKFYGVEVRKTYTITGASNQLFQDLVGRKFTISNESIFNSVSIEVKPHYKFYTILVLNILEYEESKEILDEKEREYLQKYVVDNPAYKGNIKFIKKYTCDESAFLEIKLKGYSCYLPSFPNDLMYKGMGADIIYTLKELGLKE